MTDSNIPLDAKVAEVLDSSRLAVTVGDINGVEEGNRVTVWRIVEINDPDTGDILGSVRLDKLSLVVSEVFPKFCVASVRKTAPFGTEVIFASTTKRIRMPGGEKSDNTVVVLAGDEATVYATGAPF